MARQGERGKSPLVQAFAINFNKQTKLWKKTSMSFRGILDNHFHSCHKRGPSALPDKVMFQFITESSAFWSSVITGLDY